MISISVQFKINNKANPVFFLRLINFSFAYFVLCSYAPEQAAPQIYTFI